MMASEDTRDWVPELDGYVSFPVVAKRLNVTRQRVFQMLDERKLTSARKLPGASTRPAAYMISDAEMDRLLEEQRQAREAAAQAFAPAEGELAAAAV